MKRLLNNVSKKTMALIMMSLMLVNYILPLNIAIATQPPQVEDYGIICISIWVKYIMFYRFRDLYKEKRLN